MKRATVVPGLSVGLVLLANLCCTHAMATTYTVLPDGSGDFTTIQAAIVAASDGDVMELGDGTFRGGGNRGINYLGKAVTVRSISGEAEACVIDCESLGRGVQFTSGEDSLSALGTPWRFECTT